MQITGPEVVSLRELALAWRRATGTRAVLVPVPLPGGFGRVVRAGALTAEHAGVRGGMTFAAWLRGEMDRARR